MPNVYLNMSLGQFQLFVERNAIDVPSNIPARPKYLTNIIETPRFTIPVISAT